MREQRDGSFFDDKHEVMEHGSAEPGVRRCCYAEQATVIESAIPSGAVVVDVGCGPALPYRRAQPWVLIGVDLSYESLRANTEVDITGLRVGGGPASRRPLGRRHRESLRDPSLWRPDPPGEREPCRSGLFRVRPRPQARREPLHLRAVSLVARLADAMCHLEPRAEARAKHGHLLLARSAARQYSCGTPRTLYDAPPRPVSCAGPDAHPTRVRLSRLEDSPVLVPFRRPPVSLDGMKNDVSSIACPALSKLQV